MMDVAASRRVDRLEEEVRSLKDRVEILEQVLLAEQELDFNMERQQWIDDCRERAAQRRRAS